MGGEVRLERKRKSVAGAVGWGNVTATPTSFLSDKKILPGVRLCDPISPGGENFTHVERRHVIWPSPGPTSVSRVFFHVYSSLKSHMNEEKDSSPIPDGSARVVHPPWRVNWGGFEAPPLLLITMEVCHLI